jgi:LPS-assembly protein
VLWNRVFCTGAWAADSGALSREAESADRADASGEGGFAGRPPGSISSAGAAADIKGYISGAGRGEGGCSRLPHRWQRRSSASFDALQYWQSIVRFVRHRLTRFFPLCYGSRLDFHFSGYQMRRQTNGGWYLRARTLPVRTSCTFLANIFQKICHGFCFIFVLLIVLRALLTSSYAQDFRPDLPAAQAPTPVSSNPDQPVKPARPGAPDADHILIESVTQEVEGPMRHLRGMVRVETSDTTLRADEVDYNADTGEVDARGHVHVDEYTRGEKIDSDRALYNVNTDEGKFYNVSGTSTPRIHTRPGLLTTQNPFYFEASWVEKLQDRYILHDGFLTDCLLPRPWWRLSAPTFDIVPGERAIAHHAWFHLGRMPIFYAPVFYKSLEKEPRKSGIIIPTFGNSSTRGPELNYGYYWAINRSFDLLYRGQYYMKAGTAQHMDFRGDINATTAFNVRVDGVYDTRNLNPPASGAEIMARGKTMLPHGWEGHGELNYLSSFAFVQYYSESFNEAVWGETHSVGYVDKHFSDLAVYFVTQENINYQSTTPGDTIAIRKLPEAQFRERDHEFHLGNMPLWFSFESSAGLESRSQPLFQTRRFMPRTDLAPQLNTAFHWAGFNLVPSFGIRETTYGSSVGPTGAFVGTNLYRSSREFKADLLFPTLQRIYDAPSWMGQKVKHVIEPRVTYTDVEGISNFAKVIRLDDMDIFSNTNQLEFSLTNRLLAKDKNGTVTDFLTWQIWYDRYFDPTFGGAVVAGERNVVQSILNLTGYSFLDGLRHSSPVVNAVRMQQGRLTLDWRLDYDPVLHKIVNSSASANWRLHQYFLNVGHTDLQAPTVLAPTANQFNGTIGYGEANRRGWGAAFGIYYDMLKGLVDFTQFQVTYNTDCCGASVQYRRFNLGSRDESIYRFSFSISNIGTFGSLNRQERMF